MAFPKYASMRGLLAFALISAFLWGNVAGNGVFREYIGALYNGVNFKDVPINPSVHFHFIIAFAIDYTDTHSPLPTDGNFSVFWQSEKLTPASVEAIKAANPNVRVALTLGGDSVHSQPANFAPTSVSSWVRNAVASLSSLIKEYHVDGIDVDYEHFKANNATFAECVGRVIVALKRRRLISFASIAPYADPHVQSYYTALWHSYSTHIDYVNFQFYAYDASTTVDEFIDYYYEQKARYSGGKVLVSFATGSEGSGLRPSGGFFQACHKLKDQGELFGIFVWCADSSYSSGNGFKDEIRSQALLAASS